MKPLTTNIASTFTISSDVICPTVPCENLHTTIRDDADYYCDYGHPEASSPPDRLLKRVPIYGGMLLPLIEPFLPRVSFRCPVCKTEDKVFFYSTAGRGFGVKGRTVLSVNSEKFSLVPYRRCAIY
jgi:hypothetical protein